MFTKTRNALLASVAALSLTAGFTGAAVAHSSSSDKLTIHYNGDGFQGRVKSSTPKCLKNRHIQVRKANGQVISQVTSNPDGTWDNGNSGQAHGKFYATANAKGSCLPLVSKTIRVP